MSARRLDPLGLALSALSAFAGWPLTERLGLRKPVERLAYLLTREGFRAGRQVARTFQSAGRLVAPARPPRPGHGGDLFDLNLSDEQRMIQQPVRQFAETELRAAAAEADESCRTPQALLDAAHALGIAAIAVPEALGGAGGERSVATGILVAEELARGDLGIATAILAPIGVANAIAAWGSAEQQERYLPAFVEDKAFAAALAVAEPTPLFDPLRLSTRATRDGDGFRLSGTKVLVPFADEAELFLVAADLEGSGPAVFVIERGLPGIVTTAEPAMGVRAAALGRLELHDVRLPRGARLGDGEALYPELLDLARLGWSALAVGVAQSVLDYVIPYVNQRIAFGEPISHRQSVAFLVSNIAIEVESMRLLTQRAACRADRGLPFHREAHLARTLAADKAMEIGSNGVQLLGGHGFVKEHPVERWYRDLRAVAVMEGGLLP